MSPPIEVCPLSPVSHLSRVIASIETRARVKYFAALIYNIRTYLSYLFISVFMREHNLIAKLEYSSGMKIHDVEVRDVDGIERVVSRN